MPYRTVHNCLVNDDVTSVESVKRKKTKYGVIQYVMGRTKKGITKIRAIRIPVTVSLAMARELCNSVKGVFYPATPKEPANTLLTDFNGLCLSGQKAILQALIYDFEMPMTSVRLSKWDDKYVDTLPDSHFFVVTVDKKKRLLPYRDSLGRVDKQQVMVALSSVNKLPVDAHVKKKAFNKIMQTIKILGVGFSEQKEFPLKTFSFYLDLLSQLERRA